MGGSEWTHLTVICESCGHRNQLRRRLRIPLNPFGYIRLICHGCEGQLTARFFNVQQRRMAKVG